MRARAPIAGLAAAAMLLLCASAAWAARDGGPEEVEPGHYPPCSCTEWTALGGCGTSGCGPAYIPQGRTCSREGCGSTTACVYSASCCNCTSWDNQGCRAGGCSDHYRLVTRSCDPQGCDSAATCTWDDACELDPNQIGSNWQAYGFAMPGDPEYSFTYPDNKTQDMMGLAAKGNVIIGDYTSEEWKAKTTSQLQPGGAGSVVQPYVIDPTDAALGYHTGSAGQMYDSKNRPLFDGDYIKNDGGKKLDGQDRKFYESTLSDAQFKQYVDDGDPLMNPYTYVARVDATLFTNHALAGWVKAPRFVLLGAVVARDDVLNFHEHLFIYHDTRLLTQDAQRVALPVDIKRPRFVSWTECPPSGCGP